MRDCPGLNEEARRDSAGYMKRFGEERPHVESIGGLSDKEGGEGKFHFPF
jgi:hypothetical protein